MTSSYLAALALTVACEVPIAVLLGGSRRLAADALLADLLTHPIAWLSVATGAVPFASAELLVVAAEGTVYCVVAGLSWSRAIGISVLANGVTILLSLAL